MNNEGPKLSSNWSTLQRSEKVNIYKDYDLQTPHFPNAQIIRASDENVTIKDSRISKRWGNRSKPQGL